MMRKMRYECKIARKKAKLLERERLVVLIVAVLQKLIISSRGKKRGHSCTHFSSRGAQRRLRHKL